MSNYVIAYYGGRKFESPAEASAYMGKWRVWMGALGDALVNPGTPLGKSKTVNAGGVSEGAGTNRLTGYSIVRAASFDAAVDMAKACPHLEHGTIEVAEVMDMAMK